MLQAYDIVKINHRNVATLDRAHIIALTTYARTANYDPGERYSADWMYTHTCILHLSFSQLFYYVLLVLSIR